MEHERFLPSAEHVGEVTKTHLLRHAVGLPGSQPLATLRHTAYAAEPPTEP